MRMLSNLCLVTRLYCQVSRLKQQNIAALQRLQSDHHVTPLISPESPLHHLCISLVSPHLTLVSAVVHDRHLLFVIIPIIIISEFMRQWWRLPSCLPFLSQLWPPQVLGTTDELLEANLDRLNRENVRLVDHMKNVSASTCLTFLMVMVVTVTFFMMFVFIKMT